MRRCNRRKKALPRLIANLHPRTQPHPPGNCSCGVALPFLRPQTSLSKITARSAPHQWFRRTTDMAADRPTIAASSVLPLIAGSSDKKLEMIMKHEVWGSQPPS
ncbi:hypothetical protein AAHE18_17G227800 [Arachis hypogaea]